MGRKPVLFFGLLLKYLLKTRNGWTIGSKISSAAISLEPQLTGAHLGAGFFSSIRVEAGLRSIDPNRISLTHTP
jgi:hypothetical protein